MNDRNDNQRVNSDKAAEEHKEQDESEARQDFADDLLNTEQRINEFLLTDAAQHRHFLESMVKWVVWGFGLVATFLIGSVYFVYGKSIESAARQSYTEFMDKEEIKEELKKEVIKKVQLEVSDQLDNQRVRIEESAAKLADDALNTSFENQLSKIVGAELDYIKNRNPDDLLLKGLRGPPGPAPQILASTFQLQHKLSTGASEIKGDWDICAISTAAYFIDAYASIRPVPENPMCQVKETSPGKWSLKAYYALCVAYCLSFST